MNKKTNYIIPALILCFSLAFIAFPLKSFSSLINGGGNGDDYEFVGVFGTLDVEDEDATSIPDPSISEVGDTFTGPSGTTYNLESLTPEEQEFVDDISGYTSVGTWVVQGEESATILTKPDEDSNGETSVTSVTPVTPVTPVGGSSCPSGQVRPHKECR